MIEELQRIDLRLATHRIAQRFCNGFRVCGVFGFQFFGQGACIMEVRAHPFQRVQIGRASCRDRVRMYDEEEDGKLLRWMGSASITMDHTVRMRTCVYASYNE